MNATVIDIRTRTPVRRESVLATDYVTDAVTTACRMRKLNPAQTMDALTTALGTLAFMGADRAIAAGKDRAAKLALGTVKIPRLSTVLFPDGDGPRAA